MAITTPLTARTPRFSFEPEPVSTVQAVPADVMDALAEPLPAPPVSDATPVSTMPQRPSIQFPRVDPSGRPAPTFDDRAARRQRLAAVLGLIGTIAAGRDRPTLSGIASGIARGAGMNLEEMESDYEAQLQGYQDWLKQAEEYNRQIALEEAKAQTGLETSDYEAQRDAIFDERTDTRRHQQRLEQQADLQKLIERRQRELAELQDRLARERRRFEAQNPTVSEQAAMLRAQKYRPGGTSNDISNITPEEARAQIASFEEILTKGLETRDTLGRPYSRPATPAERERALEQISRLRAIAGAPSTNGPGSGASTMPQSAIDFGLTPEEWNALTPEEQAAWE